MKVVQVKVQVSEIGCCGIQGQASSCLRQVCSFRFVISLQPEVDEGSLDAGLGRNATMSMLRP